MPESCQQKHAARESTCESRCDYLYDLVFDVEHGKGAMQCKETRKVLTTGQCCTLCSFSQMPHTCRTLCTLSPFPCSSICVDYANSMSTQNTYVSDVSRVKLGMEVKLLLSSFRILVSCNRESESDTVTSPHKRMTHRGRWDLDGSESMHSCSGERFSLKLLSNRLKDSETASTQVLTTVRSELTPHPLLRPDGYHRGSWS
jgi:hypothetical protein